MVVQLRNLAWLFGARHPVMTVSPGPHIAERVSMPQWIETPYVTAECGSKLQLLAVELGQQETYHVRLADGGRRGTMLHCGDGAWEVRAMEGGAARRLTIGSPDGVFLRAMGGFAPSDSLIMERAAPHWPAELRTQLARRRVSGCATVAFDSEWFLEALRNSPVDCPLLFPQVPLL